MILDTVASTASAADTLFGSDPSEMFMGFKPYENENGTSLESFLQKFGTDTGKLVDIINPLATFDVNFEFYPSILKTEHEQAALKQRKDTFYEHLESSKSITQAILAESKDNAEVDSYNKYVSSIIGQHDSYANQGKNTFLEYLAKSQYLVGGENYDRCMQSATPLNLQLGLYVQSITIPKIKIPDGEKSTTLIGEFPTNGMYVIPDNNQLQMDILCTKLPLHERIFYPWLREVTLPYWSYDTQPYTTAKITVDFSKHTDLKYVFCGCRPSSIETIQPTQEPSGTLTRQVVLIFDFMFIQSNLTTKATMSNNYSGSMRNMLTPTGYVPHSTVTLNNNNDSLMNLVASTTGTINNIKSAGLNVASTF